METALNSFVGGGFNKSASGRLKRAWESRWLNVWICALNPQTYLTGKTLRRDGGLHDPRRGFTRWRPPHIALLIRRGGIGYTAAKK